MNRLEILKIRRVDCQGMYAYVRGYGDEFCDS
jgi:hypothetical protein